MAAVARAPSPSRAVHRALLFAALFAGMAQGACSGSHSADAMCGSGDAGVSDGPLCNAFDGGGCACGNTCVWHVFGDMLECRSPTAMPVAFEQACDAMKLDCAAGLACVQLRGDMSARCYKVCDPTTHMGCDGLMGMSPAYMCSALSLTNGDLEAYGVCTAAVSSGCDPLMDTCPMDQTCTPLGHTTQCRPAGTMAIDGDCSRVACRKGLVCVGVGATTKCYAPCDPNTTGMCPAMSDHCVPLAGVSYGICKTPMLNCDLFNDMCPMDQNCTFAAGDLNCAPAGTTQIGGDCGRQPCARGGVCVYLMGTLGPTCYPPCDPTMAQRAPCPMGTMCTSFGESFGVCK